MSSIYIPQRVRDVRAFAKVRDGLVGTINLELKGVDWTNAIAFAKLPTVGKLQPLRVEECLVNKVWNKTCVDEIEYHGVTVARKKLR